jgi:aerobic C4-dicarboxylate transport protein
MSEARALTNFSGNAVATVLIGKSVGEFDPDQAKRVLSGAEPFDETTMIDDEEPPPLAERPLPGHPVGAHHGDAAYQAVAPRT